MNTIIKHSAAPYVCMALLVALALAFKLSIFTAGAPYVTIDDYTLFNGGFLVWFGQAPPQRMYFESWIVGFTSITTYIYQLASSGQLNKLGLNIVADAYRAFQNNPDSFVLTYRAVMLVLDMLTAWLVFLVAKNIFNRYTYVNWLATFSAGLYLLSYNTIWCNIVARPDTCTALFATLGIYFYYKSNFGEFKNYFYGSAIALGCATGFKLHGAFFVIFFIIDLIRQLGFRQAMKLAMPFGIVAVFIFSVVAGSPLFDPLVYAKLRAMNALDDASPWIKWGDQFIVVLRGTGWLIIPGVIAATVLAMRTSKSIRDPKISSLVLVCILFLIFFCCIRQLRAYWMLPALPLFYLLASYLLAEIKNKIITSILAIACFGLFSLQCFKQVSDFDKAEYGQLKDWVSNNIPTQDPVYIIGYDTLFLPKNTVCLQNRKRVVEHQLSDAISASESFTSRHLRLWEERSDLMLIDMLNVQSDIGFNYYSLNATPMEDLNGIVNFDEIKYFIVLKNYHTPEADILLNKMGNNFQWVTTANAPGGKAGTGGLPYDIYKRIQ